MKTTPLGSPFGSMFVLTVTLIAATLPSAVAQITLYTTSTSEGIAYRSWYGGNTTWIAASATTYMAYYDPRVGQYSSGMPVFNFPLASLGGQSVSSAVLHLYTSGTGSNSTFLIRDYSAAINASGTAAATYAESTNGVTLADVSASPARWWNLDVTSDINYATSQGWTWITFNVSVAYPTTGANSVASGTFAGYGSANAPYVSVTAVPEPATYATVLGALVLALAFRRKHGAIQTGLS